MTRCLALFASVLLAGCSPASEPTSTTNTPPEPQRPAWKHGGMVSAANPAAVDAAIAVLERGGHAVDAAIAAHAVLGLVEPESSGIGGSAFMVVYDRASDSLQVFDGRETAPAGAGPDMFMKDGEPLGFRDLWPVGVTVGVPGAVSLYEKAHQAYGRRPWSELFADAISLANDGFEVTEKFVRYNEYLEPMLQSGDFAAAADYLFPNGTALVAGDRTTNAEYAATLNAISASGAAAFYSGAIAESIVSRAAAEPVGSSMTVDDLSAYKTVPRDAVCGDWRDKQICSVPPPSSGIVHVMIPSLYDRLLSGDEQTLNDRIAVFVDAQRLAYADRDHYVGDPDFADVPFRELISPEYLDHRAGQRFAPDATPTHGDVGFANPVDKAAALFGNDRTAEAVGTSHLSIIDAEGNAVSMTASVGFPYGSVRMTNGFFLNNELTDFSREPNADGTPAANAIAPGKRPRSSMSPTIILDANRDPAMLTGSAGGSSILAYSTKTILGVYDWEMSAQQAADFPNIVARGESVGVEVSAEGGQEIAVDLAERGFKVSEGRGENSGLHVIVVREDGMDGAADSRRHGTVSETN